MIGRTECYAGVLVELTTDWRTGINQRMNHWVTAIALSLATSCGGPSNPYEAAYFPVTRDLSRTSDVAVHTPNSQSQFEALSKQFEARVKSGELVLVGRTSLAGPSYDLTSIKELAKRKGADTAIVAVWRNQRTKQPMSYGWPGTTNNYHLYPYIPPYQAAPPQGGLLEGLVQHEDAKRLRQREDQARREYDAQWTQMVWFFRSSRLE